LVLIVAPRVSRGRRATWDQVAVRPAASAALRPARLRSVLAVMLALTDIVFSQPATSIGPRGAARWRADITTVLLS